MDTFKWVKMLRNPNMIVTTPLLPCIAIENFIIPYFYLNNFASISVGELPTLAFIVFKFTT